MSEKKETMTCEFSVDGMHCATCEVLLEKKIGNIKGVDSVTASLADNKITIKATGSQGMVALQKEINAVIKSDGYQLSQSKVRQPAKYEELLISGAIAVATFIVFLALQKLGIVELFSFTTISYPAVFLIGILASLSSCMAVVGSLVLTLSSHFSRGNKALSIGAFHVSRVVTFFILGGVIGFIGAKFMISKEITFAIDLLIIAVMVILALDLIDIFPEVKKFSVHMPKVFGKEAIKVSESSNLAAPIFLGALTFFLPCGFTQSMQAFAFSSGSFIHGALVMGIFSLGTLPILLLISVASKKFAQSSKSGIFYKTSGILILLFAMMNLVGALVALGVIAPIL